MKHNQISEVNKPIMALSESLSHAVNDNNWIGFIGYSDFLLDLIGLVSDRSISPNRSTILRSLFDIVNHVSVLLLEKGEYYQFTKFTERTINRYYERNKENETGDVVSYLAGDMVINSFIKAIYDEIWKLAIEDRDYVYQQIKQLDSLKILQFLFIQNGNPSAFQHIVSTQFDAIAGNASINNDQKSQILIGCIKEFFRITERDLGRFHTVKSSMNKDVVIDSYIYDWTSILRQFYLNNDKELIKMVFSFMSSPTLGNDLVEKMLYPCLAINLLMIAITDSQYEHEKKENLLSFNFKGKYNNYCGITHYINTQGLLRNKDLLKRSYLSMVKLVEVWKERSNRSTTFDYTPEIFLILVNVFMYDPRDYPEILKWTIVNGLPRCDRFYEFIEDIKTSVKKFPDIGPSNSIRKSIISISQAFESIRCRLENEKKELIINLDILRNEAYSLLSNT